MEKPISVEISLLIGTEDAGQTARLAVTPRRLVQRVSPLFWPWEPRRVPTIFVARIASPAVVHQLFDELHSIGWQEAPRLPSCDSPSSDRHAAVHQHRAPDTCTRNSHWRRHYGNTMTGAGQCY